MAAGGGAGFGILATKGAYLLYPYIRNSLFKAGREKGENRDVPGLRKKKTGSSLLLPSYHEGVASLRFSMVF